ncbi:DNA polymerase III subunit gamma/tau [Rhizobiales bacterium]|uniref:DNA polymerase III subunit gamma/tau n=1 Tax=Hongsoonwoonella zoysiae TaxID=2821844 RepID=UPI001560D81F|nr:DNA polymerase III subunit gamma/tau [Hongsoonwoonella zoysiae]NRG16559.1 DNA polymerase III subunit gamma/tau [Hongsoonwoonella zoysiae]
MDGTTPPEPGFDLGVKKDDAYRVLARKYRPRTFDDLVGQEPMVRTLQNAFETGRIAQAWMLTGVRGVGKTTTARILARGLNYEIPGEAEQPTIRLDKPGIHCEAIMEGRHVDVIEMDAASHTGIGDIREITDAARYRPASARYKVYIIDEVHMLSNAAFNGLLKTLEEPPEHVKFIFATTEIRKVPVTVLSRCQRFDLRRIDAAKLVALLRDIAGKENIDISDEALALIARAGEGSARDSLSLLDQAIAHGGGHIGAEHVREMLGLADRARVIDLFEQVMRGDAASALEEMKGQYDSGADPVVVLSDLADFTHLVTRLKIVPKAGDEASVTEAERTRGREFAEKLSLRLLSRAWQILLKGIAEVQAAPKPLAAADMVLVRLAYAADLPDPEEALKALREGALPPASAQPTSGGAAARQAPQAPGGQPVQARMATPQAGPASPGQGPSARMAGSPSAQLKAVESAPEQKVDEAPVPDASAPPVPVANGPRSLAECAALAAEKRDIPLKVAIERNMRLVSFEPGRIEFQPTPDADADLAGNLGRKLTEWTGTRWICIVSRTQGRPTLFEEREANKRQLLTDARSEPLVAELLAAFPGAEIVNVHVRTPEGEAPPTEAVPENPDEGEFDGDDQDPNA